MNFKSTAIATAFSLALTGAAAAQDHAGAPIVSVVGVASEDARPDVAVFTLSVIADRPNANDAANENTRIMTAVVDGLKGSGVDAKDITTVGIGLAPVITEQRDPKTNQIIKSVPNGFRATNILRVRVREIDRTGALIAACVQNGALYQGLMFDLSDREAREDALRVKAAGNAMHRASLYAQGVGMKLGSPRSLNAFGSQALPEPGMMMRTASAAAPSAAPLPIEPGLISLRESVNASWELTAP